MTATMTDAEIREALARAERATPGPWTCNKGDCIGYDERKPGGADEAPSWDVSGPFVIDCGDWTALDEPNAEFIAHARTDVPRLAADLLAARADRDEARAFLRDFLHTTSGKKSLDGAPLSRLESAAQRLLSPTPSHTCQIHRATSGASDCGLEPCEEAKVHRDRGAARPATVRRVQAQPSPEATETWRDAIGCAPSPPGSISSEEAVRRVRDGEATPFEADTAHEAAKCATCGGTRRTFNDGTRIPGIGWSMSETKPCPTCAHHGCGGGA